MEIRYEHATRHFRRFINIQYSIETKKLVSKPINAATCYSSVLYRTICQLPVSVVKITSRRPMSRSGNTPALRSQSVGTDSPQLTGPLNTYNLGF